MTSALAAPLPAPSAGCRITVCIPARNEAALIGKTLGALTAQRALDGRPLPDEFFDVIVFANDCRDATAAVARGSAVGSRVRIFVLEERLHATDANVGTARKFVLDLAAARFLRVGKPNGVIASIDSDTLADADWIAWIAREMRGRDAVAGHVSLAPADQERLLAPVRLLYARELAYRRVLAEVEALIDPRPEDPRPRHTSFVGASFAVTAGSYVAAGGLPPAPRLEDYAFAQALRRIDARIRYSPFVRATTSARLDARVDGGFGTFLSELHACARRGDSFRVEHPLRTLEDLESRAAIRRIRRAAERADDIARTAAIFNLAAEDWLPAIAPALPLGAVYEQVARLAEPVRRRYPRVPVEEAIDTLRAAAADAEARQRLASIDDALDERDAG